MPKKFTISPLFFLILSGFAIAESFDCSLVYDEFDSLMHKEFLVDPDNYISTITGEISFKDFNSIQKGLFYLRKDRPDKGIGIVFTNDKLYGKFIFDWTFSESLKIEDIIIYSRVEDGYAPVRRGPVTIQPGQQVDLDSATVFGTADDEGNPEKIRADLKLSTDKSNPVLKTINQARVHFPTKSLCR